MMDEDLLDFWRKLNQNNVRFIMVGGLATRFHGYSRITEDLDMWIDDTLENRQNLRKAFDQLEYGDFPSIETMQFVPGLDVEEDFPQTTSDSLQQMGYTIHKRGHIGRTELIRIGKGKTDSTFIFEAVADRRGDDDAEAY